MTTPTFNSVFNITKGRPPLLVLTDTTNWPAILPSGVSAEADYDFYDFKGAYYPTDTAPVFSAILEQTYTFGSITITSGSTDVTIAAAVAALITTYGQGWTYSLVNGTGSTLTKLKVFAPPSLGSSANTLPFNIYLPVATANIQTTFSGGSGGLGSYEIAVNFQVLDPTGQVCWQNNYYNSPNGTPSSTPPPAFTVPDILIDTSVTNPPNLTFQTNLPTDIEGNIVNGNYTINAIYTVYLIGSPYTTVNYTVQQIQVFVLGNLCVAIGFNADCFGGAVTITDETSFPLGTIVSRTMTVTDPNGLVETTSFSDVIIQSLWSTPNGSTYQVNIVDALQIPITGGGYINITIQGFQGFTVECAYSLCVLYCGLTVLRCDYFEARCKNPEKAQLLALKLGVVSMLLELIEIAISCGQGDDINQLFAEVYEIGGFKPGCGCGNESQPQLIKYNTVGGSGGSSTYLNPGLGMVVTGNGSSGNPYISGLSPQNYSKLQTIGGVTMAVANNAPYGWSSAQSGSITTWILSTIAPNSITGGAGGMLKAGAAALDIATNGGIPSSSINNAIAQTQVTGLTTLASEVATILDNYATLPIATTSIANGTLPTGVVAQSFNGVIAGATQISGNIPAAQIQSNLVAAFNSQTGYSASKLTSGVVPQAALNGNVLASVNSTSVTNPNNNTGISGDVILAGSIPNSALPVNVIAASNIRANAITAAQIANSTITTAQISGTAGILGTQLANQTVGTTQMATSWSYENFDITISPSENTGANKIALPDRGYSYNLLSVTATIINEFGSGTNAVFTIYKNTTNLGVLTALAASPIGTPIAPLSGAPLASFATTIDTLNILQQQGTVGGQVLLTFKVQRQ